MRKYGIKTSNYGTMPSSGYAQELMKMVSSYDGWQAIQFLKHFSDIESTIEDTDGEIFFCFDAENDYIDLNWEFFANEDEMVRHMMDEPVGGLKTRYFRFFSLNQDFGLEELERL